METPGQTLKRLRKRAGLRQATLAARIGCCEAMIGHWERDLRLIDAESALWLAQALAFHPSEFRPDLPWPEYR